MAALKAAGLAWNIEEWGGPDAALPPLLLLHGFTGRGSGWQEFAAPLAHSRRCIAPDLPGHGKSDPPASGFRLDHAACGLEEILDALGIGRACVLGYSMGGRLALHLALRAPSRIERLVLVGVSPGIEDAGERRTRAAIDEEWAKRLLAEGMPAFVEAWMSQPLFASVASLPPERLLALRQEKLTHTAEGLAAAIRAFGPGVQRPLHAALARITAPVLLVAGALDPKYCRIAEMMAAEIPAARLAIVEGAGHAPQFEAPELFDAAVAPFLAAASWEG